MNLKNSGNPETQPSMLHHALAWWAAQDDMGGFKAVAVTLFPGWRAKRSCRAPHREDRTASFSLYKNAEGVWRFKDHATGEQGGLVGFVMLAGGDEKAAARWLMERCNNDECRMTNVELMTKPEARIETAGGAQHSDFGHSGFIRHSDIRHSSFSFPSMPASAISAWNEGLDHMEANPECTALLATLRGWPKEFARYLVECACVSMPLYSRGAHACISLVSAPDSRRCARYSNSSTVSRAIPPRNSHGSDPAGPSGFFRTSRISHICYHSHPISLEW